MTSRTPPWPLSPSPCALQLKRSPNRFLRALATGVSSWSQGELVRAYCVFQTCAIGPIVRHCDTLYDYSLKILGARLFAQMHDR